MTMPTRMNCPHSETGWCLPCVKELADDNEAMEKALKQIVYNKTICAPGAVRNADFYRLQVMQCIAVAGNVLQRRKPNHDDES